MLCSGRRAFTTGHLGTIKHIIMYAVSSRKEGMSPNEWEIDAVTLSGLFRGFISHKVQDLLRMRPYVRYLLYGESECGWADSAVAYLPYALSNEACVSIL